MLSRSLEILIVGYSALPNFEGPSWECLHYYEIVMQHSRRSLSIAIKAPTIIFYFSIVLECTPLIYAAGISGSKIRAQSLFVG